MKKSEEIKKGLESCVQGNVCRKNCPYSDRPYGIVECTSRLSRDALAYIQQLESKLNQAVEDFRKLGGIGEWLCPVCAYYNHGEGTSGKCVKCLTGDGFRWRGEKMDEPSP